MDPNKDCSPKWRKWCMACCSTQLWVLPGMLLIVLISIEYQHTKAHNNAQDGIDVHGWCKQAGFDTQ